MTMGLKLPPGPIKGRHLDLEPLCQRHRDDVRAAFAADEAAWEVMVYNGGTSGFPGWWERVTALVESGSSLVYAVRRRSDERIVGCSGYFGICHEHLRVEIGSTFYQPDARGTAINAECKLLLMSGAFDGGAIRVEFVTDALNARSRAALSRLGATEEGILRHHKITWTGRIRDTVIFAILREDWPLIQSRLRERLRGAELPGE